MDAAPVDPRLAAAIAANDGDAVAALLAEQDRERDAARRAVELAKTVHIRNPAAPRRRGSTDTRRHPWAGMPRRQFGPDSSDPRAKTICGAPAETVDLSWREGNTKSAAKYVTCPNCLGIVAERKAQR